jgi:hypothetical protein
MRDGRCGRPVIAIAGEGGRIRQATDQQEEDRIEDARHGETPYLFAMLVAVRTRASYQHRPAKASSVAGRADLNSAVAGSLLAARLQPRQRRAGRFTDFPNRLTHARRI